MSHRANLKRKNTSIDDESPTIKALKYTTQIESYNNIIHDLTINYVDKIKDISNNKDINNIFINKFMIEIANNFGNFLDNTELNIANLKNIDCNLKFLIKTLINLYTNKKKIHELTIELNKIYTKYTELQNIIQAVHQNDKKISKQQHNLDNDL